MKTLESEILDFCSNDDSVTFPRLSQHLESRGFDVHGDDNVVDADDHGIWFWTCMSRDFANAVTQLNQERKLRMYTVNVELYLRDGCYMGPPLAKRNPGEPCPKPRFVPVCLRTVSAN